LRIIFDTRSRDQISLISDNAVPPRITIDELAEALWRFDCADGAAGAISLEIWARLRELGMIERGADGEPKLTSHDEVFFVRREYGDCAVD
jgi:hypothetical protein